MSLWKSLGGQLKAIHGSLNLVQSRSIQSKSARNQGVVWIGQHKLPLTEEQHRRQKDKHKPFVLGRDNVKRVDEPIAVPPEALLMKRDTAPFQVLRTKSGFLPVYTEFKCGRGQVLTVIRRVEGQTEKLCDQLKMFIPKERVSINPTTQHVVVKGNYARPVRYFLTAMGY